nr:hypothetical protein CFP56_51615 [Quercus suber]
MQALQIRCTSWEASVKCLKNHLETEADSLKKFKKSAQTLGQEVIELKAKLGGVTHQTDELMKENADLKSKVATVHKHMDKVKEEAIEEFQVSQPYFNEVGGYYRDGFEDFRKQDVLLFLDLNFSQIQIRLNASMTPATEPILNDVETDDEVLVTNGPGDVVDDPKELERQTTNPPDDT